MLTLIQSGEVIVVFVALAYWLVSCCIDPRWWDSIVEETKTVGEIPANLSNNQDAQPEEDKQSSYGGLREVS